MKLNDEIIYHCSQTETLYWYGRKADTILLVHRTNSGRCSHNIRIQDGRPQSWRNAGLERRKICEL